MSKSINEIKELTKQVAATAWDSYNSGIFGEPAKYRLNIAIDAANQVWIDNLVDKGAFGYDVEFIDGPMQGLTRHADSLETYILDLPAWRSIIDNHRALYQRIPKTFQYKFLAEVVIDESKD